MSSPFPGMDPFVEMQEWEDFQTTLTVTISEQLAPKLAPRYVARIQRREFETKGRREPFLVIRDCRTGDIVTVIETLSPATKEHGSEDRKQFLSRRNETLRSNLNLVEIDLVRSGESLPDIEFPKTAYSVVVSRAALRPKPFIHSWTIRQSLPPPIAIPLGEGFPDVFLDLQAALTMVYDRASYQLTVNYSTELLPPLSARDAAWVSSIIPNREGSLVPPRTSELGS